MCARADQRDTINLTVDVAKKKQILVPGARIELATPAFSGRRSTNELPRLFNNLRVGKTRCVGFCVGSDCGNRDLAATFKLAGSLFEVLLARDVVTVEDGACLVA